MKIKKFLRSNLHTLFTSALVLIDAAGCILIVVLLSSSLQSGSTGHAQEIVQETDRSLISESEAAAAAFKDSGVDNSSAKQLSCELLTGFETAVDESVYNVSFKSGSTEYNYQISSTNGRVLAYTSFYSEDTIY